MSVVLRKLTYSRAVAVDSEVTVRGWVRTAEIQKLASLPRRL